MKKCNVDKVTGNPQPLYQYVRSLGIKPMPGVALPTPYILISITFHSKLFSTTLVHTSVQCDFFLRTILQKIYIFQSK